MTFAAIFAIAVGILMAMQWTVTIMKGQVAGPEAAVGGRGKLEMAFHLVAELATAFMLIMAGSCLLVLGKARALGLFFIAIGMLLYTVINSPGYFAQQRRWAQVAMFAALLVLTVVSLILVS